MWRSARRLFLPCAMLAGSVALGGCAYYGGYPDGYYGSSAGYYGYNYGYPAYAPSYAYGTPYIGSTTLAFGLGVSDGGWHGHHWDHDGWRHWR